MQTFDIINEAGFGYQTNVLSDPEEKVSAAFNTLLTGGNRCVMEESCAHWREQVCDGRELCPLADTGGNRCVMEESCAHWLILEGTGV